MSNALATLSNNKIQMSEVDRLLMAEAQQEAAAFDFVPPRLKIAPGSTNVFQTDDGDVLKNFTGIILISQKARAYWPSKGSGQAPLTLVCLRCGEESVIKLPLLIDLVIKKIRAFAELHADCIERNTEDGKQ